MKNYTPKQPVRKSEQGQALILIALGFVVLLGFVGLTTDVGNLFVYMGHLRRSIDAASLAAAAQYREGRSQAEMTAAAFQVLNVNGVDPALYSIQVQTCETNPSDPELCTTPRRKLVRVVGSLDVPMSFLSLVGVNNIQISANSIGEAASLDIVLVIDISESMVWDAPPGDPLRDPSVCNATDPTGTDGFPGECHPFEEVKRAAIGFVNQILNKPVGQEEDRLSIVTFANGWSADVNLGSHYRTSGWTSDNGTAQSIIRNLIVFNPRECFDPRNDPTASIHQFYGPCRFYNPDDTYAFLDCLSCRKDFWPVPQPALNDWSALTTTNIGGGLLRAGNMFALNTREDALWVVVLLTDGMANATDLEGGDDITNYNTYPLGYCPNDPTFPLCQDENVSSRHASGNSSYDADDYARDMADFVGCYPINTAPGCGPIVGQGAVVFAIGLGDGVLDNGCSRGTCEAHSRPYGASLLRYIAAVGYDGDPATDPCAGISDYTQWCGNYYFAPQGPQLYRIFEDIASRIFTRIAQ